MARKMLKVVAGAAALLSLGAGAANAAVSRATGPAWQSVGRSGVAGEVTAVTTIQNSGKVAEFAFVSNGSKPSMYARSNNESWALSGIPGAKVGERVVSAKAIALNEALVFTNIKGGASRVLKVTGHSATKGGTHTFWYTWTVLKSFSGEIGSASVETARDVWVFGSSAKGAGKLGVWRYNGKTWTQVSKTFTNGTGTSGAAAWAASGTTLEHYNGSTWTATSIAGLLSSRSATVSTIFPGGQGGSPYAIVSENAKPAGGGGPIVVLEYNRHAWVKVASYASGSAVPGAAAADGASGMWFPVTEGAGKPALLLHFGNAHHTLTAATLPGLTNDSAGSAISSIAQIGDYTKELVGGDIVSGTGNTLTAKIYYLS